MSQMWIDRYKPKTLEDYVGDQYTTILYYLDDMIGALKVIPESYNKITFVGSGYTDQERIQMRQLINNNKSIKIDVKYQEISPSGSMQFPVFLRIREIQ